MLLFNWIGYRCLYAYLENTASQSLEARLDRQQYDQNQLISFKIPISHLLYYNSSTSFQRTSGQVEVNGIPYRYVASRIFNDSLEMRCIPNIAALTTRHANSTYLKLVYDYPQGSKEHPQKAKAFTDDAFTINRPKDIELPDSSLLISIHRSFTTKTNTRSLPTDERPPIGSAI